MPTITFATTPLEIYGYTVLSIKTALLRDNVTTIVQQIVTTIVQQT